MKRNLLCIALAALLALAAAIPAAAKHVPLDSITVGDIDIVHTPDNFFIKMTLDLDTYKKMESNREVILTPKIAGAADTLDLASMTVAGRARYYLWLRQNPTKWPAPELYRASETSRLPYSTSAPMLPWMDKSEIVLEGISRGCCGEPIDTFLIPLVRINLEKPRFNPQFPFVTPAAELEKWRELRGSAYIDFPVNRTELYPDYRRNPQELQAIRATIDSVRLDKDVTFKSMTIKGYASPEGPYKNNIRLAKGRTETLKEYLLNLYSFPRSIISTSYEPEDWEGLRRYVEKSGIDQKGAILALIDSDMAPDPKNDALRSRFPRQYAFLLKEVYPGLRHSDYTVEYVIRNFTDVEEIKHLLFTNPKKLSLNEMFVAANAMDPDSPEYYEAFEIAVRMYPANKDANLNAALIDIRRGEYKRAEGYLAKVGDIPQAIYARGLILACQGDYEAAKPLLDQAAGEGLEAASDALRQIKAIEKYQEIEILK